MTILQQCPICFSPNLSPFIDCVDFTVSREKFHLVKCDTCDFIFTNPRPETNDLSKYYESEDYISHSNSKKGFFNTIYQLARKRSINSKLKLIADFNLNNKTIADVGCGTGEFLNAMKIAGWSPKGFEPSEKARNFAINNYALNISTPEDFLKLNTKLFSVITMWHVLEHIEQPIFYAKQLFNLLLDDGVLIIAVPNAEAFEIKIYKEYWAAYDVPRHLNHFTKNSISDLFNKSGFKIEKIIPMPFDSFYISMLSEKYKGSGKIKMFYNMLINGLKSNLAAKTDITKASSLIYVLRKSN